MIKDYENWYKCIYNSLWAKKLFEFGSTKNSYLESLQRQKLQLINFVTPYDHIYHFWANNKTFPPHKNILVSDVGDCKSFYNFFLANIRIREYLDFYTFAPHIQNIYQNSPNLCASKHLLSNILGIEQIFITSGKIYILETEFNLPPLINQLNIRLDDYFPCRQTVHSERLQQVILYYYDYFDRTFARLEDWT